jgi:arylsulfatase A-like enzyme
VFCSDNGGIAAVNVQAPWRAGKGSYYEGGVREPMVFSWLGTIKDGRSEEFVNALDFNPTFMEVARLDYSTELDGVSLMPLLTGTGDWQAVQQFWHFPVYLQVYNGAKDQARDPLFRTRPGSALCVGQWKLHEYFGEGALELYNLFKDRGERHNLAAAQSEKAAELKRFLDDWRQRVGAPVPSNLNSKYNREVEAEALD